MINTASKHNITDFTTGSIATPLIAFSLPLLFGNILQQLYSITDSIIVGNILGSQALAAIGASTPITRLSIALTIGVTLGLSVLVSQYFGAHQTRKLQLTISTGYLFFSAAAIIITGIGTIFSELFLSLIKTPHEILSDATDYLQVNFLGTFFMVGYNVINSLYRGVGNSRFPLYLLILSTVINIILDIFFLAVLKLGVVSTAWATIFAQAMAFFAAFFLFQKTYPSIAPKQLPLKFNSAILKKCLKIGIPSGIKGSMYWGGFILLTTLVNSFGTSAIAAFSLAGKIDSFLQTPMVSLQHGLTSFTGQNAGANKPERIQKGVRASLCIGIIFSLCMTAIVFFGAEILMHLFTKDSEIRSIGTRYLQCVSLFYAIYAIEEVVQGVAIGCGNTLILLISTFTAMWVVRIPLAYMLAPQFGLTGIWLSIPSGWFIAVLFCNGYYMSGLWKKRIQAQNVYRSDSEINKSTK